MLPTRKTVVALWGGEWWTHKTKDSHSRFRTTSGRVKVDKNKLDTDWTWCSFSFRISVRKTQSTCGQKSCHCYGVVSSHSSITWSHPAQKLSSGGESSEPLFASSRRSRSLDAGEQSWVGRFNFLQRHVLNRFFYDWLIHLLIHQLHGSYSVSFSLTDLSCCRLSGGQKRVTEVPKRHETAQQYCWPPVQVRFYISRAVPFSCYFMLKQPNLLLLPLIWTLSWSQKSHL